MSDPASDTVSDPVPDPVSDTSLFSRSRRPAKVQILQRFGVRPQESLHFRVRRVRTPFALSSGMPRPFRLYVEGLSVHVMHRGINRMPIFDDDDDYHVFLRLVRYGARLEGVDVHSFALMKNHYHLQVTPRHALALPRAMKRVNGDYSSYYNRKHRRTGTIWGYRPRTVLIEDERQWLNCLRYIEQNPVRAGLVSEPQDYPWSSNRVHALGEPNSWLTLHATYLALGASPRARQEAYAAICSTALTESELALQRCPLPDRRKHPAIVPAPAPEASEVLETA